MGVSSRKISVRRFLQNIILPTLLTIGLFIALIFAYVIPSLEQNLLNSKKSAIRELVSTACGIASKYSEEAKAGQISEEAAKSMAVSRIEHLRYGVDDKDYFWITDMHPAMIMHPYRSDLNGTDLTEFRDPNGKALFVEMVNRVQEDREGYVDYEWQWMDDSLKIVPKISYVRAFEPWGWIVGTGVYIEDVRSEIAAIQKRLTLVSIAIITCMAFLLFLIARQNLSAEIKRNQAEAELQVSREKYKALVEASTEGTAMFLGSECIFSNIKFQEMLGVGQSDQVSPDLLEIIASDRLDDQDRIRLFNTSSETFLLIETLLERSKGVTLPALLSLSKVTLAGKKGLIVVAKELMRDDKSDEGQSERGQQLLVLAEALGVGIFKCTAGRNAKLIDVNEHMVGIFGYPSKASLLEADLADLADDNVEVKGFLKTLILQKSVKDFPLRMRRHDAMYVTVAVSAALKLDRSGEIAYIYGTMFDVSRQQAIEQRRDELFGEMQGRLLFMDQAARTFMKEIVSCEMTLSVGQAAKLMNSHQSDSVLVRSSTGEYLGMITDSDIRRRLVASTASLDRPVYEFMTSPLISISEGATLSDAVILMQKQGIDHLCVTSSSSGVCGTLRKSDLVNLCHSTGSFLAAAIENASSVLELKAIYQRLPLYVRALSDGGAHTSVLTDAITSTSDAITAKLEQLIIRELGTPPVPYAFIALGSEGRCEQTLLTDQDNALVFESSEDSREQDVRSYFEGYGKRMSLLLNEIGYRYCVGEIMASNPRWNQPFSEWQRYFATWITRPEPKHLLESAIFFDFRAVCGDQSLVDRLRDGVHQLLADNPSFLGHLALEGMSYKTPLGLFGRIHTESDEDHSRGLNIKSPLRVIVNLVRLYAMKHRLSETNTVRRIQRLQEENVFSSSFYKNLYYAYDYMMLLQLRTQALALSRGKEITNHVDLTELSTIELGTLKNVLAQLGTLQNKTKFDFGVSE